MRYRWFGAVFFVVAIIGAIGGALYWAQRIDVFPIVRVGIDAPMARMTPEMLTTAIEKEVTGSFFGVSLHKIREKIEKLAWVKGASVRRVWPNAIEVKIEESRPVAYWHNHGVITDAGTVIRDLNEDAWQDLPAIEGSPTTFKKLCDILAFLQDKGQALNIRIKKIGVSSRSAWRVELQNGILIILGRNDIGARIGRFLKCYGQIYDQIKDEGMHISYIDMRYRNGIAVGYSPVNLSDRGI